MSGGGTISTSETRIEALQLQSSAYGVTVPYVRGVTRLPGNMLWYGNYKATPHTESQGSGGKGGGVEVQNTTYTYSASVMMALGHGRYIGIPRVWVGKQVNSGGIAPSQILTTSETYTVPGGGGSYATSHASAFASTVKLTAPFGSGSDATVIRLAEAVHYTVSGGVYAFLPAAAGLTVTITYQYLTGTVTHAALQKLGLSFIPGVFAQSAWAPLSSLAPGQAIGYSGMALLAGQDYQLGAGAQIENHLFEVQAPMAYSVAAGVPDADPADFTSELLLNGAYGAAFPSAMWADASTWSDHNRALNLLCSPAITEQVRAADMITAAARFTNSEPVWSAGRLKIIPYTDQAATGNGKTYTPNTTPIYDLDDRHFLDKDAPIVVREKSSAERFNHIRIEYRNRGTWDSTKQAFTGAYSIEIAEAKDQADIDARGLRSAPVEQMHWIGDSGIARNVAQLLLQRSLFIANEYTFRLPMTFDLLEGMDLVTVTDPDQELNKTPVRITNVDDDNESLTVTAEDFPLGSASATLYPSQSGAGFLHDYNVSPGSVQTPTFFEAPVELTTTGLEVLVAVRGTSPNWAGCRVWISSDGNTYKEAAKLYGGSRYGSLTGPIAAGTLPVSLVGGQLLSGSASDAAALATLCYVGGASPEYLAYTTAMLTGPGTYDLGGMVRGAYSTAQTAHAAGAAFVRVDDALARSGSLDLSNIGKTIYFKFTSFNIYNAAEESLASVPAYPYLITGVMAALPPSAPTGVTYAVEPFGIRLKCAKNPEPDVVAYEWRAGATWAGGQVLDANGGTSYLWAVQSTGAFSVWVAAVDFLGNYSTPVQLVGNVAAPSITSLLASIVGTDLQLDYAGVAGGFALGGYEIRYGSTYSSATVVGVYQVTRHVRRIDWVGTRRWWVTPVDVKGNFGTPSSTDVAVVAPGQVTSPRSEVVDNNVLLYWAPPASGSLPVAYYDVKKGASYALGTSVGSNGNSTFGTVFEQQAGTFTYWVAAVDSAGNVGTPVGITATVSQPPDYVLRVDYNSTFTGTLSGTGVEDGKLYGPSRGETYEQHFNNLGWSTPQDQITAGYPLYFQPSANSGYYEEVLDYGTVLASTTITVTITSSVLAGSVTTALQISYKKLVGDAWTDAAAGANSVLVNDFRYVKVRVTLTASGGDDLIEIRNLNIKLAAKLKTDSGTGTASASDSGGTPVTFNVAFVDVDGINVTPQGTTARFGIYDFVDAPNPTTFKVLLFDKDGNRVSGAFSWSARGY